MEKKGICHKNIKKKTFFRRTRPVDRFPDFPGPDAGSKPPNAVVRYLDTVMDKFRTKNNKIFVKE
jgi:hypothetical protein